MKANTLYKGGPGKRLAELAFGSAHFHLALPKNATLENLSASVAATMQQSEQDDQWYAEGNPKEAVDFGYYYPIVTITASPEVDIFLKWKRVRVKTTESWMNLSDRLTLGFGLPRGALFRIFPVDMDIQRLGDDDHAYSFDWEEGKQYWFDIIKDQSRDKRGQFSRELRMVDAFGRVDRLVVPANAGIRAITGIWRGIMDVPDGVEIEDMNCYWGYRDGSATQMLLCTLVTPNSREMRLFTTDQMYPERNDSGCWESKFRRSPNAPWKKDTSDSSSTNRMIGSH
jgi:hypothetical protein